MDMSVWYIVGAILVFFMQCGFAAVEAGFTSAKNAGNIIMKNLMDFYIGTVVFTVLGYQIAQITVDGFHAVESIHIQLVIGGAPPVVVLVAECLSLGCGKDSGFPPALVQILDLLRN